MRKLLICLLITVMCFSMIGGVFAESVSESNFMDIRSYDEIYKMSEDSDVKMPFIKLFAEKAIYDKLVGSSGISIAAKGVDIKEELKGVQTILSADTVKITGKLEYANIVATNVEIDGEILKDVMIIAESIFITDKAKISGDLVCISDSIDLQGHVSGNSIIFADTAKVSAKIDKDFRIMSKELEISATTDIKRDIYIETDSALNILDRYPNAVVKKYDYETNEVYGSQSTKDIAVKGIIVVLSYVALYYIIKKLTRNTMARYSDKVKQYPIFTILIGFASLFIIPAEILILLIGCAYGLGAVLGPILILYIALVIAVLWLSLFITGVIVFECVKAKVIVNKEDNKNTKWLEAGLLIVIFAGLYILTILPVTSGYANAVVILVAVGSVVTNMFRKEKQVQQVKEI